MSTLNGIHDAQYLAQFLGKRIAIRDAQNPNKYYLYPKLFAIFCNSLVRVEDSKNEQFTFEWEQCESPYIILNTDVEVEIK